jgi:ribosomal protein L18E
MATSTPNPSPALPTLRQALEAWERDESRPIARAVLSRLETEDARRAERAEKAARP